MGMERNDRKEWALGKNSNKNKMENSIQRKNLQAFIFLDPLFWTFKTSEGNMF